MLNKDVSQAYNLLMESFSDSTLEKLFKYERIRDLYQFMTEIILKKNFKPRKERKDKKDSPKEITNKKSLVKSAKINQKTGEILQDNLQTTNENEWSFTEQRYLCAMYLQRSLIKCCDKLKQKFGQSPKWNTTKKVFKKAEQIFQKSIKKAFRSSHIKSLKEVLLLLQTSKQNLIGQIVKRKSNQIEKFALKFYKTNDPKKKAKILEEINNEMLIILQKPEILKKESLSETLQLKREENIKKQAKSQKPTENKSTQLDQSDSIDSSIGKSPEVKLEKIQKSKVNSQQLFQENSNFQLVNVIK